MSIPRDKIREVIGTGGKVIREICEVTGAKVDIEDDGTIKVAAVDGEAGQKAIDWITSIVAEPEVGTIYNGKVVKLMDFGAFVNFLGSKDGLVHISELAQERVGEVGDVVSLGDEVKVKVIGLDDRGKVKLSMRAVNQETGEEIPVEPRPPRGDRGDRAAPRTCAGGRRRLGCYAIKQKIAVKKFTAFFCSAGRRQLFRRHCHTDDIIAGVDIMDLAGHGT